MFKTYSTAKGGGIIDAKNCKNGDIGDFCFISCKLILENNIHIAVRNTMIGKGIIYIDEGTSIAPQCVLYTSMPNLLIGATNKYMKGHIPIIGNIKIGKNVLIGTNSVIGCGAEIKDNVRLPPFSHVKPGEIVYRKK